MDSSSQAVLGCLRSLLSRPRRAEDDDRELLRRFLEVPASDAFALLLQRHGPMVLGLARRVLGDWQPRFGRKGGRVLIRRRRERHLH